MEEGQCWIWTKRKHSSLSSYNNSQMFIYGDSWEEQAFAEDERLGGCIWPPRSYSCSFCSREFRSAQALGGHMNVHRRDRARLKQPRPSPHNKQDDQTSSLLDHQNSFTSSYLAYSNANPNSDNILTSDQAKLAPPLSLIQENSPPHDSCVSWSNFAQQRLYSRKDEKIMSKIVDTGCNKEEGADTVSYKRRRITDDSSSIPLISSKSIPVVDNINSQMFEFISPSSIEELDLELRLGHSPPKLLVLMEFNRQSTKKLSKQVRWSPEESGARSYTCAFCKRGFSNAQALGGHMNIHRIDRAKLIKQSSEEENSLSLDISIKNPSTCTSDDDDDQPPPYNKPSNSEEKVLFPWDSETLPSNPFFSGNNNEENMEIDLELRLGHQSHEASTVSTREFF